MGQWLIRGNYNMRALGAWGFVNMDAVTACGVLELPPMSTEPSQSAERIAERLAKIEQRIAGVLDRAGRERDSLRIVAVTKTHPASVIEEAYQCGLRHFGENRVQEFAEKRPDLELPEATFHLVGHLQSNKVKRAVELFDRFDSVDSLELARRLGKNVTEIGGDEKVLTVLLQVNVGGERAKGGVDPNDALDLAAKIAGVKGIVLEGLMCIPPYQDVPDSLRPYFQEMIRLVVKLGAAGIFRSREPVLSMGMSHDFEVAIEEGATEIRLGTALFGERDIAPEKART